MTNTSSPNACRLPSSSKGSADPGCGCAPAGKQPKTKTAKNFAGFVTLCAICCAVPPVLVAFGVIGIATGAYLSTGVEVLIVILAMMGLGLLLMKFVKKKR